METDTEDYVEYDLDKEDTVWLKMSNEHRRRENKKVVSEALLERCMDRLEKESHFQVAKSAGRAGSAAFNIHHRHLDNDVACCVCNDDDTSDANLIIFCDMCNIAVHQASGLLGSNFFYWCNAFNSRSVMECHTSPRGSGSAGAVSCLQVHL